MWGKIRGQIVLSSIKAEIGNRGHVYSGDW